MARAQPAGERDTGGPASVSATGLPMGGPDQRGAAWMRRQRSNSPWTQDRTAAPESSGSASRVHKGPRAIAAGAPFGTQDVGKGLHPFPRFESWQRRQILIISHRELVREIIRNRDLLTQGRRGACQPDQRLRPTYGRRRTIAAFTIWSSESRGPTPRSRRSFTRTTGVPVMRSSRPAAISSSICP